jgi:hypothetical protein
LAAGHSAAIIVESAALVGSTDFYRHVKLAKTKTRKLKPALLDCNAMQVSGGLM